MTMLRLEEVNHIGTLGGVSIRHASASDLPDIHAAFLASFSPYHWVMSQGELTHYLARLFEPRVGPFGGYLLATRGGRLLGAATYDSGHGYENDIPWGWARLGALAVLPEARRMGVGRFLLAACAAHARAQGAWAFFVRAPEFMVPAVGLAEGMKLLRLPNLDLPMPSLVGTKARAYVINLD
jgi:GNAT superfamily N-acetyltransferase